MSENRYLAERSALLVMDFHTAVVENYAADQEKLLDSTCLAIAAAREASIPIIYIVVGFRSGFPEVSPRNPIFGGIKQSGGIPRAIHPRVAPLESDIVVTKHRISAFVGTDLELILRANDIHHLIICGIATSGVVLSTVRQASDMDFELTSCGIACPIAIPTCTRA